MNHQRLYEYRFRDVDQSARVGVWGEIAAHVHELMGHPQRVLDPAAGRGEFINAVAARERWAIDFVAHSEGTYDKGVNAIVSDIFEVALPDRHFDGVFVSNFLEHLPMQETTAHFLELMHAAVDRGGRIAVMGPNFRYCQNQYFDMADHTLIYTHRAIAEHLFAAGFEPERIIPRYLPYSFTGILPPSRTLTRWYLNLPLAWRVLGKQFLVIARR
jgi:2-polyprenyl-3-methyl-5-hydroxy-6-metoxy-1,4-benzoquinol methylase